MSKVLCLCCEKEVENQDYEGLIGIHPMDGTAFNTYGHYGSTCFDPMDGTFLELCICNECLPKKKKFMYGTGVL